MVVRCTNKKDISRILNHPKIFRWISDDLSFTDYVPELNEAIIYLMNREKTGVIRIDPFNGCTCQVHTAALPDLWGKTHEFVRECIEWGFANTRYFKVITFVPEFNRLAIRLAEKSGFKREGCVKKSFLKDWKLHDLLLLGLTKEDFLRGKEYASN